MKAVVSPFPNQQLRPSRPAKAMKARKANITLILSSAICASTPIAQETATLPKIIVDIGSNLSGRAIAVLKTAQVFGGDGLVEVVRDLAPKELKDHLIVILERAESNMLVTKFDIAYTIIYGDRRVFCEKPIETGFAPGGSYTVNRPKVAFETSVRACLSEFFASQ